MTESSKTRLRATGDRQFSVVEMPNSKNAGNGSGLGIDPEAGFQKALPVGQIRFDDAGSLDPALALNALANTEVE